MFGFDRAQIPLCILVFDRPRAGDLVIRATSHSAAHLELAAQRFHFFRAYFPHHARASPRITEGMDERLDDFAAVAVVSLRNERVLDRATERKSSDPLSGPVGRDFLAAHSPDFFSVALEECIEEPFAELIAYPFFEIAWVAYRKQTCL